MITPLSFFFFFNDTATTEIYTLSLHDALPIFRYRNDLRRLGSEVDQFGSAGILFDHRVLQPRDCYRVSRSEEHTSELQSRLHLVCRLLLEKKKITYIKIP